VRAGDNLIKRPCSSPKDTEPGVRADQAIALATQKSINGCPEGPRRVSYFDKGRKKQLVFLSNNFDIAAKTVAEIYKQRLQVGLFFKWVKQRVWIEPFYGTAVNAVKSRILSMHPFEI